MEQLVLLDPSTETDAPDPQERPWELDERTRAVGRHGLEQARRALARSAQRQAA